MVYPNPNSQSALSEACANRPAGYERRGRLWADVNHMFVHRVAWPNVLSKQSIDKDHKLNIIEPEPVWEFVQGRHPIRSSNTTEWNFPMGPLLMKKRFIVWWPLHLSWLTSHFMCCFTCCFTVMPIRNSSMIDFPTEEKIRPSDPPSKTWRMTRSQ